MDCAVSGSAATRLLLVRTRPHEFKCRSGIRRRQRVTVECGRCALASDDRRNEDDMEFVDQADAEQGSV